MSKIAIKELCHENWESMTPTEQGRHCLKCVKTVHDVSLLHDNEIIDLNDKNNNNLCIRIPAYRIEEPKTPWYYKYKYAAAAFLLTLWLSVQRITTYAQQDTITKKSIDKDVIIYPNIQIIGTVQDSLSDDINVAYAMIILYVNNNRIGGTFTDEDGKFTLKANQDIASTDSVHITISHVGYSEITKPIPHLGDTIDFNATLGKNHVCLEPIFVKEKGTAVNTMRVGNIRGTFMGAMSTTRIRHNHYDTKTYYSDEIERMNLGR